MLQRDPSGAGVDHVAVPAEERFVGFVECEQAAVDARDVCGELLGVDPRGVDARRGKRASRIGDRRPQPRHACCSLDCLSAAASASKSASSRVPETLRSPVDPATRSGARRELDALFDALAAADKQSRLQQA